MIDPFAIPTVRAQYESQLTPEDRAGIGKADINGVINVFLNKLREVTGLSDQKMAKVPLAVVIGKTDSANLAVNFSEEKVEELQMLYPQAQLNANDAVDYLCRKFLRENEMGGFVNAIEMKFSENRFFAASAIGHTRNAGPSNPKGRCV